MTDDRDAQATPTLVERLGGYNPPDRAIPEQRQIAQDIMEAKTEIERLQVALTAATARAEEAEKVIAQHDLCHNLHGKVDAASFAEGCAEEQRKLYGCAPHADRLAALEAALMELVRLKDDLQKCPPAEDAAAYWDFCA